MSGLFPVRDVPWCPFYATPGSIDYMIRTMVEVVARYQKVDKDPANRAYRDCKKEWV